MSAESMQERRTGDAVAIPGDYQYKAFHQGNPVQRFWHYAKQVCIDRLLPPEKGDFVLDIGCGSGLIASHLAQAGACVMAIDGNPAAIAFAREQFASSGVQFHLGLIDESVSAKRPADKAYCLELIEHIYYPQAHKLLENIRSLLRPGGQVLISTPNYHSAWPVVEWVMDHVGVAPRLKGTQHVEFYHRRKLGRLCGEAGLTVQMIVTSCFMAPWLAPFSWTLAKAAQRVELSLRSQVGCILLCLAQRPI